MAWIKNDENSITWDDAKGFIAEVGRGETNSTVTYIAVKSPDGQTRYITVNNAGAVSSSTTKP